MSEVRLAVENVGGIDSVEVTLSDGVTLVTGENASNKSSLLRALLFALGSDDVPLRTGADRAVVTLKIDGRTVERTATREPHGVSIAGEPFVTDDNDATLLTRFAGLLETNPLRTAVQTNADFEELLKEPMDIDALERERTEKLERKRTLQRRLDELEGLDADIESTKTTLEQRRDEADELSDELERLYDELPERDEAIEELRTRRTEAVSRRERLADQIEDIEAAVERIDENVEEIEAELAEARDVADGFDLQALRRERSERRSELDEIDDRIDVLQSVLTANREMLATDVRGVFEYEASLEGDSVECWACGQQASTSSFEETLERLTEIIESEKARRREHEPAIEEIEDEIEAAEEARRTVSRLEERLHSAQSNRESREQSLEEKREQVEEIEDELADIDRELADAEAERAEDRSDISEEIEETRVALETKRREIERLDDELADLRAKTDERERVREELDSVTEDVHELTNRIENLEADLRDSFNEAMDGLLDALAFEEIERMWLEGDFELVIAREIDGSVREDSIGNLAESERAIIGLVLGLAGYLAYDVETIAPVLVLDSLGAFDAERTRRLVDYFGDHADYLVAAVHPEQVGEDGDDHQLQRAPGRL